MLQQRFAQAAPSAARAELQGQALMAVVATDLDQVSSWIAEIHQVWSRGTGQTMELARLVSTARKRLGYGEWARLWKSGEMPFSKRKGEMLVVIGEKMGERDAQTFAHLPTGWSVLYCLARLKGKIIDQLIKQGIVHPKLTLREARELVAQFSGRPVRNAAGKSEVTRRLRLFRAYVQRTLGQWRPEERERMATELARLIEQIAGRSNKDIAAGKFPGLTAKDF